MSEIPSPTTIEQDIAKLEKELQEKKAILEHQGENVRPSEKSESISGAEKEILKTILGEKITQQAPSYQLQPSSGASQTGESPSYLDPALKDKIDELVKLVFSTSLEEGIKEAVKSNNPALTDAFHDILTDELYNALLERRKIEKID